MTGGAWAWWREGELFVVGWLRPEQFSDNDIPVCTVHDPRDAGLVVSVLTDLEAEPVIS